FLSTYAEILWRQPRRFSAPPTLSSAATERFSAAPVRFFEPSKKHFAALGRSCVTTVQISALRTELETSASELGEEIFFQQLLGLLFCWPARSPAATR